MLRESSCNGSCDKLYAYHNASHIAAFFLRLILQGALHQFCELNPASAHFLRW